MLEWAAAAKLFGPVKAALEVAWRRLRPRRWALTSQSKLAARQKWKPLCEAWIADHYAKKLRTDVIVRDMRRMDHYPEIDEKKRGISPWFRVGLQSTYHRGIQLSLGAGRLILDEEAGGLRCPDYRAGESGDVQLIQFGSVPYEQIEDIDWDGDEYYSYPHIYCYFDRRRMPYEEIRWYVQHEPLTSYSLPFYTELQDIEGIRERSRAAGVEPFV
jgi:hypothetical protein